MNSPLSTFGGSDLEAQSPSDLTLRARTLAKLLTHVLALQTNAAPKDSRTLWAIASLLSRTASLSLTECVRASSSDGEGSSVVPFGVVQGSSLEWLGCSDNAGKVNEKLSTVRSLGLKSSFSLHSSSSFTPISSDKISDAFFPINKLISSMASSLTDLAFLLPVSSLLTQAPRRDANPIRFLVGS
ncbi:hypothetical protein HJC23_004618 [Cyclotella cryptica]|uniref:Uncharacterized protein n=1 Tax=Cyclotella cryptica TaxID=29204 RepID=A0ABD3QEI5_9STRA